MISLNQLGLTDASNYDSVVHKFYHDVSDMAESDEPPKVKLESDNVDFGKIWFVCVATALASRGS